MVSIERCASYVIHEKKRRVVRLACGKAGSARYMENSAKYMENSDAERKAQGCVLECL